MFTQENTAEFIERYLMGKLTLWELAEMEDKIRTDPVFAEEVAFQRDLLIGIRESRRLELKGKLRQVKITPELFRINIDRKTLIRYAIAACVILMVTGSIHYQDIRNSLIPNSKRH